MKWILVCVSLLSLPLAAQDPAAAKNRRELMSKLTNDVTAARPAATLTDAQKKELDTALASLQKVTSRTKKGGERPDPEQTRAAMKTINQLSQGDAFQPDDKKKIQDDLKAIREFQQAQQQKKSGKAN